MDPRKSDNSPKLVFVISKDHGELVKALAFLEGQELAGQAIFFLLRSLYEANRERLQVAAYAYRSVRDIIELGEFYDPDTLLS